MAKTAKLGANYLVRTGLEWCEPDRNERTRDRVTTDAHVWQEEIVNHIFRGKFKNNWAIHRHMKFALRNDIVFAGGIVGIEAHRIRVGHKADIAPAKLSVRPSQLKIPAKLLANDVDDERFLARRKLIHLLCPERNRKSKQEYGLDQDNREFQMRRDGASYAMVIRSRLPPFPEANQDKNKKCRRTEKRHAQEEEAKVEHMID